MVYTFIEILLRSLIAEAGLPNHVARLHEKVISQSME